MPTFEEKEKAQGHILFLYKTLKISQKYNYLNLLQCSTHYLS